MKKVDVGKIMEKISSENQNQGPVYPIKNQNCRGDEQNNQKPVLDGSQIDQMKEEELIGLLHSYNAQFLEMLHFKSFEPVFAEYGSLQDELNTKYRILPQGKGLGFIQKIIGKVLGFNRLWRLQEQFNAVVTRIINRNIEVNTNITHEIYQIRTQLHFLSIQMKICTRLVDRMHEISKRLDREIQHVVRRDEYLAATVPELNHLRKKLKTFLNQLYNGKILNGQENEP